MIKNPSKWGNPSSEYEPNKKTPNLIAQHNNKQAITIVIKIRKLSSSNPTAQLKLEPTNKNETINWMHNQNC